MHARLRALEMRLGAVLLGPRLPVSPQESVAWNGADHPPLQPKWDPPPYIHKCDGGFMLNTQTVCFQRGRCPQCVYDSIIGAFAHGFNHDTDGVKNAFENDGYDFIIAIRNHQTHTIAAACMVELRCSPNPSDTPFLYIYELTTISEFSRHGLAHQLVHAVDALAYLMKSDQLVSNTWHQTLSGKRLFMGLTVHITPDQTYVDGLKRLYSKCGMRRRDGDTPQMDYKAFWKFSTADWCIDRDTTNFIAMWKEVVISAVYSDDAVRITKIQTSNSRCYYHAFPEAMIHKVRLLGIVHPAHRCLYAPTQEDVYIPDGTTVTFTHECPPSPEQYVFAIWAECSSNSFNIPISVPAWYAADITPAGSAAR